MGAGWRRVLIVCGLAWASWQWWLINSDNYSWDVDALGQFAFRAVLLPSLVYVAARWVHRGFVHDREPSKHGAAGSPQSGAKPVAVIEARPIAPERQTPAKQEGAQGGPRTDPEWLEDLSEYGRYAEALRRLQREPTSFERLNEARTKGAAYAKANAAVLKQELLKQAPEFRMMGEQNLGLLGLIPQREVAEDIRDVLSGRTPERLRGSQQAARASAKTARDAQSDEKFIELPGGQQVSEIELQAWRKHVWKDAPQTDPLTGAPTTVEIVFQEMSGRRVPVLMWGPVETRRHGWTKDQHEVMLEEIRRHLRSLGMSDPATITKVSTEVVEVSDQLWRTVVLGPSAKG